MTRTAPGRWFGRTKVPILVVTTLFSLIIIGVVSAGWMMLGDVVIHSRNLQVMRDGSLRWVKYSGEGSDWQVYDLEMQLIATTGNPDLPGTIPMTYLSPWRRNWERPLRERWPLRIENSERNRWYAMVEDGYLEGYDQSTEQRIGFLGRNGFATRLAGVTPFAGKIRCQRDYVQPPDARSFQPITYLVAADGLYRIDFGRRMVTRLIEAPGDSIIDYAFLTEADPDAEEWESDETGARRAGLNCVILEPDAIVFYDENGARRCRLPLPKADQDYPSYQVALGESETVYIICNGMDTGTLVSAWSLSGEPRWDTIVANPSDTFPIPDWQLPVIGQAAQPGILGIVAVAVLALDSEEYETFRMEIRKEMPWGLIAVPVGGIAVGLLVSVLIHLFHLRHQPLPRWQRRLWLLALFLFPLYALFPYWMAMDWSPLVRCPACGRRRALIADRCPRCNQPFPPPSAKGIELIERPSWSAPMPSWRR